MSEQKLSTSCEEKNSLGTNIAVGVMGLLLGALLGVAGNSFLGHKGKELKNLGLRLAQASIDGGALPPGEKISVQLRDEEAGVTLNKASFKAEPTV